MGGTIAAGAVVRRWPRDRARSAVRVDARPALAELARLVLEPDLQDLLLVEPVLGRVRAHILRDLHAAEMRAAHRAEVRLLGRLGWKGTVVVFARGLGIEGEVELVVPPELEPSARQGVVPFL